MATKQAQTNRAYARFLKQKEIIISFGSTIYTAYSLVGFWAGLGWLVLVYCERKTLLAGWFRLAETNTRTE